MGHQLRSHGRPAELTIPIRLHLDAQQLMREAVANAVRHAEAKIISIDLAADADDCSWMFINDGAAYPTSEDGWTCRSR